MRTTLSIIMMLAALLAMRPAAAQETLTTEAVSPRQAIKLERTAALYVGQGHPELALPLLEQALVIREDTLGKDSLAVARTLLRLGMAYSALHQHDDAESSLRRALAIRENVLGAGHPAVQAVMGELGKLPVPRATVASREP